MSTTTDWLQLRALCLAYLRQRDANVILDHIERNTASGISHLIAIATHYQRQHKSNTIDTTAVRQHMHDIHVMRTAFTSHS